MVLQRTGFLKSMGWNADGCQPSQSQGSQSRGGMAYKGRAVPEWSHSRKSRSVTRKSLTAHRTAQCRAVYLERTLNKWLLIKGNTWYKNSCWKVGGHVESIKPSPSKGVPVKDTGWPVVSFHKTLIRSLGEGRNGTFREQTTQDSKVNHEVASYVGKWHFKGKVRGQI